jgi:hypothetical protein
MRKASNWESEGQRGSKAVKSDGCYGENGRSPVGTAFGRSRRRARDGTSNLGTGSDDSIGYRFRCSFGCDENDDEDKGYLAPGVKASLPCYNWAVADGTLMRSVLFGGWRISRACGWHDDSGLGGGKGIQARVDKPPVFSKLVAFVWLVM